MLNLRVSSLVIVQFSARELRDFPLSVLSAVSRFPPPIHPMSSHQFAVSLCREPGGDRELLKIEQLFKIVKC